MALALAARTGAEIVSVDSMQVYRGLDVGTAKPSAVERVRVPHHLIDVVDLTQAFDAAQFVAHATAAIDQIRARGRLPVLCGGTGLYFRALFDGLGTSPPPSPALRDEFARRPLADLLAELEVRDPATFASIDRNNPRRIWRALEVIRLTGHPLSHLRARWTDPRSSRADAVSGSETDWRHARCVVLTRPPNELRARIDARVDAMFAQGLVEETRSLLGRGLDTNPTAALALGYRQTIDHLRGVRSLPDTMALVKRRTWQFARRQLTWFRHQFPGEWLTLTSADTPDSVARRLLAPPAAEPDSHADSMPAGERRLGRV